MQRLYVMIFNIVFSKMDLEAVNLDKIQQFIDMGRLPVHVDRLTTMRDLLAAGVISSIKEGVKLLAKVIINNYGRLTMRWHRHACVGECYISFSNSFRGIICITICYKSCRSCWRNSNVCPFHSVVVKSSHKAVQVRDITQSPQTTSTNHGVLSRQCKIWISIPWNTN